MDDKRPYEKVEYWEERYSRDSEKFEWFLSYSDFSPLLEGYLPFKKRGDLAVLDIGCGTSALLKEMYDDGFTGRLVGLDCAKSVVDIMNKKENNATFVVGDLAKTLTFEAGEFDVVFDKSTMDALLHGDEKIVTNMISECSRVLAFDGIYIVISQMDFDKPEDSEFFQSTFLSSLVENAKDDVRYEVDGHKSEGCPFQCYVCRKRQVFRRTRQFEQVSFTAHFH